MKLTEKQIKEFEEATKPAIRWMNKYCDPHMSITITTTSADLASSLMRRITWEFLERKEK